jgi:hypothetical protein
MLVRSAAGKQSDVTRVSFSLRANPVISGAADGNDKRYYIGPMTAGNCESISRISDEPPALLSERCATHDRNNFLQRREQISQPYRQWCNAAIEAPVSLILPLVPESVVTVSSGSSSNPQLEPDRPENLLHKI